MAAAVSSLTALLALGHMIMPAVYVAGALGTVGESGKGWDGGSIRGLLHSKGDGFDWALSRAVAHHYSGFCILLHVLHCSRLHCLLTGTRSSITAGQNTAGARKQGQKAAAEVEGPIR